MVTDSQEIPQAPKQAAPNLAFQNLGFVPTTQQNVSDKSNLVQPTMEQLNAISNTFVQSISAKLLFRDIPVITVCPHCKEDIITETENVVGPTTVGWCFVMVVVCLWAGCCLIPFCVNGAKDVIHYCPKCRFKIHKYKRGERLP